MLFTYINLLDLILEVTSQILYKIMLQNLQFHLIFVINIKIIHYILLIDK